MTGWGFTAALSTEDTTGPYCDVTVLINDWAGQLTDRAALPWIALASAPLADPDRLAKGLDAAPGVLAAQGWRLTGEWTIADNAAYADAEPMPVLLVSPLDVLSGALTQMPGVTGVWWTDTHYLECTEHLAAPYWTPDEAGPDKTGVVLSGPADPAWCDAHREAGWTEVVTDGKGGVVSQRRLTGPEAGQTEQAYRRFTDSQAAVNTDQYGLTSRGPQQDIRPETWAANGVARDLLGFKLLVSLPLPDEILDAVADTGPDQLVMQLAVVAVHFAHHLAGRGGLDLATEWAAFTAGLPPVPGQGGA
jgi:hypothetical protein